MIIDIISKFNDKGVKKATRSFSAFAKSTLGAQLSLAGVAYAMGKMVRAAAEDEKAVAALSRTLANAGWSRATEEVNAYIDATQRATGVADDELRPAFTGLFNALGDANAAMGATTLAMDIAAGTGKSLQQVTESIAKAATGNRKSLLSLGTGIDKVTLQTADLNTILGLWASKFSGQAATAAETTAGKMARLKIASNEAAETIGGALVDAFVQLSGGGSITSTTQQIDDASNALARFIREASGAQQPTTMLTAFLYELGKGFRDGPLGALGKLFGAKLPNISTFEFTKIDASVISSTLANVKNQVALQAALKKLQEQQAKAAKAAAAAEAAKAAAAAKALKLKKLAYKFDYQAANIAAAQKRAQQPGIANRLDLLSLLSQDAAGLPVSDKALAAAQQQVTNITVNVSGSLLTEAELTSSISAQMLAQRIRNGTLTGSPGEFRQFEMMTR